MKKIELNKKILNITNYEKSKSQRQYFITKDARIITYDITRPAFEAISAHNLGLIEGKLLSQGFLSALMLSQVLKNPDDTLSYRLGCSGPIGGINVECRRSGDFRGFIVNNPADVKNLVIHNLSDFIGAGFITCTKHIEGFNKDQESSIMIEKGSIPYETAVFFRDSEQINTTVAMWVNVENGIFQSVQGLLLQAMPAADDSVLEKMQNIVRALDDPYFISSFNMTNFVELSFGAFHPQFLEKEELKFFCPCSKEHYINILRGLEKNKSEIFKDDDSVDVSCSMCSSVYKINKSDI